MLQVAIGALNALLFLPAKLMAQTAIGQAAARMLGKGKAPKGKAPPPKDGMVDLTVGMDRITGAGGDRGSIGRPERSMSGVV